MNDVSAIIDRKTWKSIETPSYPGNSLREMVHLLDKLGLIQNYGTGIPRTLNAYKSTRKEPLKFLIVDIYKISRSTIE